jgi:hypothetical protein
VLLLSWPSKLPGVTADFLLNLLGTSTIITSGSIYGISLRTLTLAMAYNVLRFDGDKILSFF